MYLKTYLVLNILLACGTFHSSFGKNLKYRKRIYEEYVSRNKFEGKWIDPNSLGIADYNYDSEEELEYSSSLNNEETISNKDEVSQEKLKSFSKNRIHQRKKLQDTWDIGDSYETESNSIFALLKKLSTFSIICAFLVFISFVLFPKTLILFFSFVLSVGWHWMKLYQEKIAEKQNITENLRHPNECHRGDLHWYESIYLYLSSFVSSQTDCKEYYKAILVDPFWEVSLPVAVMNAFTSTVCEPMKVFATTLRFCLEQLFKGMTLTQLGITLIFLFIILIILNGYSFSFCWGAISLYRPKISGNQTTSQSLSFWGMIAESFKALCFRRSPLSHPFDSHVPLNSKEICYSNKGHEINTSEKPDDFQKQEKKGQQNAFEQFTSLHSEKKNRPVIDLKIPPFKKCHKRSISC